ncbi:MAG: right-handed parallel beta-helix repeat-containing protein [Candidatus Limnocylindrales bacterium]
MRNIRVADRAEWVFEAERPLPSVPRSRARDWLATATMFLIIPALILPFAGASAGEARLAVAPDPVAAGERITVRGNGLPKGEAALVWDGDAELTMPIRIKGNGALRMTTTVPRGLSTGNHELAVVSADDAATLMTAAQVTIVEAAPEPTVAPTPVPTVAPTPEPITAGVWAVAFGTRPSSAPVRLSNCSNVVIENKTFRDLGAGVIAIRIENCSNVTIRAVDFLNVAEGVYALNSTNIQIIDSRYSNITGPAQPRTGANVANFVQFNNVAGGLIDHNKGKGGDTEDIISIYQSDHVIVEDNHLEGTNWTSASGSGIALSDGGGSYNVAQRNVLVNPGQVGIFIAGGTNNEIIDNTIYGEQRLNSNVGLYVWSQSSGACSGNEVSGNRVMWRNAAGASNSAWNANNCGTISGWSTNTWNATLNVASLRVAL